MSININDVQLELDVNFSAQNQEEILRNIQVILTTPVGTVPFDREFGVDPDIVDLPVERAKNQYTIECIQKIKKYEPRANVKEVRFENDAMNSVLKPKVVIELVGD
jgi:phage baseplate assembly protein W